MHGWPEQSLTIPNKQAPNHSIPPANNFFDSFPPPRRIQTKLELLRIRRVGSWLQDALASVVATLVSFRVWLRQEQFAFHRSVHGKGQCTALQGHSQGRSIPPAMHRRIVTSCVERIADDGASKCRKLSTNLVGASRQQLDFQLEAINALDLLVQYGCLWLDWTTHTFDAQLAQLPLVVGSFVTDITAGGW